MNCMNQKLTAAFAGLALMTLSCFADGGPDLSKLPPPSDRTGLTFTNDIEPIFKASCVRCHSGQRARANLHLDTLEGALNGGFKNGQQTVDITPGNSQTSPLVIAVARLDPKTAMPPMRRPRPGGPPPGMAAPGGPDGSTNAPLPVPPSNAAAPGGPAGPATPPPPGGRGGPPALPLTPEQVGLVRAWIDQGAK
jgi:Planctomycete cytochrome C